MRHLTVHWHNAEASVSRKPRLVLMLQRLPCHHQQRTFTGWAFNPQQSQLTDTAIAMCLVRPRRSQMPASVLVNRREVFTLLLLLWGHGLPFKGPSEAQRVAVFVCFFKSFCLNLGAIGKMWKFSELGSMRWSLEKCPWSGTPPPYFLSHVQVMSSFLSHMFLLRNTVILQAPTQQPIHHLLKTPI